MMHEYQQLNPLAAAIAAAGTALVALLIVGLPMMGFGGYGHMMGRPGYGPMMGGGFFGFGLGWWFGGAAIAAVAGALFAWIYNAVNAALAIRHTGGTPRQTP